jgi:type IV secretory pathway TraG/TraD family ATPase VirD4
MSFLEKFFLLNRNHNGLLLNGKNDRLSAKNSFTHALLVARTGGGKTSSFIIPNILDRDNASILVTDLSGELYKKTSGFMKNIGYNVLCLNLIDPSLSNTYNPLA